MVSSPVKPFGRWVSGTRTGLWRLAWARSRFLGDLPIFYVYRYILSGFETRGGWVLRYGGKSPDDRIQSVQNVVGSEQAEFCRRPFQKRGKDCDKLDRVV